MNYELSKKLRDNGFPQTGVSCRGILNNGVVQDYGKPYKTELEMAYLPTLSELIDACEPHKADDFDLRIFTGICTAQLIYHGYFEGWVGVERDNDGAVSINIKADGSTPEEAVANLWLALNTTLHENNSR